MASASIDDFPLDILYHVFSFLHPGDAPHNENHPLLILSQASKSLHAHVEAYCSHLLMAHRNRFPGSAVVTRAHKRNLFAKHGRNQRGIYLSHAWSHCAYCDCQSVRRAIMVKGIVCCKICDARHWSGKITMSEAMKKYYLTKDDLFSSNILYGQYMTVGALATMFLDADVRALAERIHGDLAKYFKQRTAASAARRQKRETNRTLKITYLRTLISANGLDGGSTTTFTNDSLAQRLFGRHDTHPRIRIPAMLPLLVCRNEVLYQRCAAETKYNALVSSLRSNMFMRLQSLAFDWDQRMEGLYNVSYPEQYTDPRDYALWDLFRKEFGVDEPEGAVSSDATQSDVFDMGNPRYKLYQKQASAWDAVPGDLWVLPFPEFIHPVQLEQYRKSVKYGCPPWGWPRYPQLVIDAPPPAAEGDDVTGKAAERGRKKVERRNEKLRKEYEEVKEWVKKVLQRGGIESPDAWAKAVAGA